ncbi:flavin reductase [Pseudonocardia halophobica]|uniref:flavin reductase n=1 Tax=Pseudonocardia halophobica TaxID=29401 RepID=UPI003D8BFF98
MAASNSPVGFDSVRFRRVLGRFPTGVVVVTAIGSGGRPAGMAVGSFTSVSLVPPLLAFFPDKGSSSFPQIRASGSFCVNVLSADQEPVCRAFATKGADKFAGLGWRPAGSGSPILDGVVAWMDCDIETIDRAGDHFIVLGRVRDLQAGPAELPLLFFQGGYGHFSSLSLSAPAEPDLLEQLRLVDAARGEMERVSAALDVECLAAATVRDQVVIVASSGEPRAGQSTTRVGQRMPFVPPLGTLLVAWEPPAAVQAWLDRLDPKLPERDAGHYRQLLERVRRRGWSISLASAERIAFEAALTQLSVQSPTPEQEKAVRDTAGRVGWLGHEPDDLAAGQTYPVRNVSGPIFNSDGRCVLMLSLFVGRRCTGEEVEHLRDCVLQASAVVTAALSGRHPDERPTSRTTQALPDLPRS